MVDGRSLGKALAHGLIDLAGGESFRIDHARRDPRLAGRLRRKIAFMGYGDELITQAQFINDLSGTRQERAYSGQVVHRQHLLFHCETTERFRMKNSDFGIHSARVNSEAMLASKAILASGQVLVSQER